MNEPKVLGTLVVVVGTAKNLPNKSRFGKQDPFCTVQIGNVKRKTQPIKRGGQHPEWDEELRFPIYEDVDDMLATTASKPLPGEPGVVTPQSMASKARKPGAKKGGSKVMKVAVWADDLKEPELIGEVTVNFDDALSKGEVDDWWTLQSKDGKDKYCGEVYMELTFFSNAPPPRKKPPPGQQTASPHRPPGRPGLPTSTSVSGMDLYIPPYTNQGTPPVQQRPPQQQPQRPASNSYGSNSFAELGLPPQQQAAGGHPRPPSMSANALAGQMGSMSLGPSHQQRPGASPHQAATLGHGRPQSYVGSPPSQQHPSHSGSGPAPWAPLLPQSQAQQPQAPPLPRPVSSNDVNAWNLDPRVSSVPPRPHSSMQQQPPGPAVPSHGRTGSLTHSLAPPVGSYGNYQAMPEPPRTASPAQYPGYQSPPPASQPGSFSQPLPTPPQQGSYKQPAHQQPYPPQQPAYNSTPQPGRQGSWPQQANQQGYQQPGQPPLPQQFSVPPAVGSGPNTPQQGGYQSGGYASPVSAPPPHRHSLPGTSPAASTTTGPYVPWHMQTQGAQSPQSSGYKPPGGAPAPPAPPQRPGGGGYYPSDELYSTAPHQQPVHHQPQQPLPPAHQPPPPQPPQNFGYQSPPPQAPPAPVQAFSPPPPQPQSNFFPNAAPLPPPRVPSPLPPTGGSGATNTDWRSYLAGLGSVSAAPVPPVGGAPQQGPNDWYSTPPPAVPSSIMQHAQAQNGYGAPPPQQW